MSIMIRMGRRRTEPRSIRLSRQQAGSVVVLFLGTGVAAITRKLRSIDRYAPRPEMSSRSIKDFLSFESILRDNIL